VEVSKMIDPMWEYPNFFKGKNREELVKVVAENLTLILGNNISSGAWQQRRPFTIKPEDVRPFCNIHFLDRAGAIVNALCAMGMAWDAARWNRELTSHVNRKVSDENFYPYKPGKLPR